LSAAPTAPNRITLFSAHQMGTARAGVDAGTHACDPVGRVRQGSDVVGGLHVADASLFPTSSGVNPMLTVMALAERSARAVLQDLAGT
jgi:choline dehydrogenase-like flavoprotein